MTILFCDVKGSTAMAERLDPEDWAEIMNEAFDYLIGPVYRYEGTVANLLGDGLLAFFGAPLAHEDDPTRGVLAALEIVENIAAFRPTVQQEYGLDFNVRVGLNTGTVVVGEIGSEQMGEYTALGDAVNLAARMEQTAQPGTVQIAEATYRLIAPLFECEALGQIEVRGKSELVSTYRVVRRKRQTTWGASTHGRGLKIGGRRAPMIGREAEVNALYEAVQAAMAGQGGIVFLTGDAGLGKTRLIEEVRARMEQQAALPHAGSHAGSESSDLPGEGLTWISARGISYDINRPYGLFRQFVYQACALQESDPFDALAARIDEAFADAPDDQRALYRRGRGYLFMPESAAAAPGELVRHEIAETAAAMAEHVSTRAPALIVLDDLHWADPASVELLRGVLGLTETLPLLFLCAMRPEQESAAWGLRAYAEQRHAARVRCIDLAPLSSDDAMMLIGHLLQDSNLPEETCELILRKAGGNPYFVEEVARMMLENSMPESDEGAMQDREMHDRALAGDSNAIPPSLQALLTARIDRLENALRRTLQLAAVIGRTFFESVLCRLADMPEEIPDRLDALIEAQFLRVAQESQEQKYAFVSELVRDAAYQSILFRARRQLHRRVAEAIEALYADRIDELANRLAEHYQEARDFGRAFDYAMRAAERAARLYALHESTDLYRKALDLARGGRELFSPSDEQLVELYTRFGRVLELTGGHPEALRLYEALDALGRERNEPRFRLAAALAQATIYSTYTMQFDAPRGIALGETALSLARQIGSVRDEARALWNLLLANLYGYIDVYRAIDYGEEALALARANNLEEEVALILHDIQRAYAYTGRQTEAYAALTEARDIFRKLDNRPLLADNLTATAENLLVSGQISEALRLAKEGGELSHSVGSVWGEAYALYMQGLAMLQQGEISRGLQAVEQAAAFGDRAQFIPPIETFIGYIGWVYYRLGALHLIEKHVREGMERVNFSITPQWQVQAVAVWFEYHMGNHDIDADYLDAVSAAIDTRSMRSGPDTIPIYVMLAEIQLACGRQERVVEETQQLLGLLRSAHIWLMVPMVLQVRGRALAELDRFEEARAALLEALEMEERSGSHANRLFIYEALMVLYERAGDRDSLAEVRAAHTREVDYLSQRIFDAELRSAFLARAQNPSVSDAPGV